MVLFLGASKESENDELMQQRKKARMLATERTSKEKS